MNARATPIFDRARSADPKDTISEPFWSPVGAARNMTMCRPMPMLRLDLERFEFEDLEQGWAEVNPFASFESPSLSLSFTPFENYHTTLDVLFVGCRVCVHGRPRTCGVVTRIMPMTGRVVVRLDPPHPSWRGTLRSFRPERLVVYS